MCAACAALPNNVPVVLGYFVMRRPAKVRKAPAMRRRQLLPCFSLLLYWVMLLLLVLLLFLLSSSPPAAACASMSSGELLQSSAAHSFVSTDIVIVFHSVRRQVLAKTAI